MKDEGRAYAGVVCVGTAATGEDARKAVARRVR